MVERYIKEWLVKASHDLQAAKNESTISSENLLTDIICFHCQQAVEKFLKAYLVAKNIEFERTHSLEYLRGLCVKEDEEFKNIEIGNLSYFAVESRYPDEFYMPSKEDSEENLELARKAKEFVLNKLKISEKDI